MNTRVLTDPTEFLALTADLLEDEARNNLILGLAAEIGGKPDLYEGAKMFIASTSGEALAAALITPPHNLVVADARDTSAIEALVPAALEEGISVPGAVGPRPAIDRFVEAWVSATDDDLSVVMEQGVFSLTRVAPIAPVNGRARLATVDDVDPILGWSIKFMEEALPRDDFDRGRFTALVRHRLGDSSRSGFWLWEVDGEPVSMSGHTGPTRSAIRIIDVYTPPHQRGNGYASSLVAHQSQWLLDSGYRMCTLFTDLSNPTSNAIYKRIGYVQVGESAQYNFH